MATSVKLDEDLRARVQQLAQRQQRSAHWIMREAIRDYVERQEAKERFVQESLASWTSYKETGKHLTGQAVAGLVRCRQFLSARDQTTALKAARVIEQQFRRLETDPETGRPVENHQELRELIVTFGQTGYVALYHYYAAADIALVPAFLHQKEVGYG